MRTAPIACTWIREARLRAGLTQTELAGRVGTTQSAIARWEAGRSEPAFARLLLLVRACGFDLDSSLSPHDPDEDAVLERNLALDPAERLDQLVRAVAFIEAGRTALEEHG